MSNDRRSRPLYRDQNDRMVGGVCSGLGHYFDIDTTLVRVAFVVIALVGGGGVLGYLILWAILQPGPPGGLDSGRQDTITAPPPPVGEIIETDEVVGRNQVFGQDQAMSEAETTTDQPPPQPRTEPRTEES